jgi:hypothetical protein
MSKAKATHNGHCQVCGAKQKLPNGRLSLHGYQVAGWGFFNGICTGARHLPFEQDISLIEGSIRWAQARQETTESLAARTRTETETVWVHEYIPAMWQRGQRFSRYEWRQFKVSEMLELNTHTIAWVGKEGKRTHMNIYIPYDLEDRDPIKHLNEQRAKAYDKDAEEIKRYITWQQNRIKDWKPSELEPISK